MSLYLICLVFFFVACCGEFNVSCSFANKKGSDSNLSLSNSIIFILSHKFNEDYSTNHCFLCSCGFQKHFRAWWVLCLCSCGFQKYLRALWTLCYQWPSLNIHIIVLYDTVWFLPSFCSFYADFGPLNLALIYRYCRKVNKKLKVRNVDQFFWQLSMYRNNCCSLDLAASLLLSYAKSYSTGCQIMVSQPKVPAACSHIGIITDFDVHSWWEQRLSLNLCRSPTYFHHVLPKSCL